MLTYSPSRRNFLSLTAATTAAACLPAGLAWAEMTGAHSISPVYPLNRDGDAWTVFKTYDPANDPDAPFYRSRIARAKRITPFAATQAHPALHPDVAGGTLLAAYLTLDNSDRDANRTRYEVATQSRVHVERFWQYQDIVVGWNTTGLIPNPSLTDAAHRNGARCLGTMFQPDKRMFDGTDLSRAEVAVKLVALANYFGFDGYFVNFESYEPEEARAVQDLIGLMQTEATRVGLSDFHIQYYDGYTDARAVWPGSPHVDGTPRETSAPRANSMMIDQGWSHYGLTRGCCSGHPLEALPLPADLGASYDSMAVYYGLQLYPGPGYLGLVAPTVIAPNGQGKAPLGSLQIYSHEDGLRKMRRARLDQLKASTTLSPTDTIDLADLTDPRRQRKAWYRLHRQFWSGQSGNPALNNTPSAAQAAIYGPANVRKIYTDYEAPGRPTDQLRLPITYGVANFIAERSVIGSLPFVTHFNTGEGDRFFRDGSQVAVTPWFNLGIQDILPTWTWWTKPLGKSLNADQAPTGLLDVDYDFDDAYDGGASLRISGTLGPVNATEVRLYKTQIRAEADVRLGLIYKDGANGRMKVGLVFEDAPEVTEWVEIKPAQSHALKAGWHEAKISLAPYSGRNLATISLGFESLGAAKPYTIRIGELSLSRGTDTTVRPAEGFRIIQSQIATNGQSAALKLAWTFDATVSHYDILTGDGAAKTWLGRITGDAYYVSQLTRPAGAKSSLLYLVPCTPDGRSVDKAAAMVTFNWQA